MKIKVEKVDIDPNKIIAERGLSLGGTTQKFMESEVIRRCEPYVPMDTGILAASARPWPKPGGGYVKWQGPYAHYQYMGQVYGPNIPIKDDEGNIEGFFSRPGSIKTPTGRQLTYSKEKHPQAGSKWVERMLANEGGALLEDVATYAGGKAKK